MLVEIAASRWPPASTVPPPAGLLSLLCSARPGVFALFIGRWSLLRCSQLPAKNYDSWVSPRRHIRYRPAYSDSTCTVTDCIWDCADRDGTRRGRTMAASVGRVSGVWDGGVHRCNDEESTAVHGLCEVSYGCVHRCEGLHRDGTHEVHGWLGASVALTATGCAKSAHTDVGISRGVRSIQ